VEEVEKVDLIPDERNAS